MSYRKFSPDEWNERHLKRAEKYAKRIDLIYYSAMLEASQIAVSVTTDPEKPFAFEDYTQTTERVESLFRRMALEMIISIDTGIDEEWAFSNEKNDALVDYALSISSMPGENLMDNKSPRFSQTNSAGLSTFKARSIEGLTLSDRVWKLTDQFKSEIEMSIDVSLQKGQSAQQLSQSVKKYLNDPDRLFRRVRDKRGSLALSKAAKNYHPGQGVYRSSYKNAMRLARTEINAAYRQADNDRFQQLDFVVGFEVRRSNNPGNCDVCAKLKGRYPKTFKFIGWHPQCRCHVVSILATPDEIRQLNERILNGESTDDFTSINHVSDVPENFRQWVADNRERLDRAKTLPQFLQDNIEETKRTVPSPATPPPGGPFDSYVPIGITEYEQALGIQVDKRLFSLFDKRVSFQTSDSTGAYFNPTTEFVNIPLDERRKQSKWNAQSTVYHEYGHALDWQRDLKQRPDVDKIMKKYQRKFSVKNDAEYARIDKTLWAKGQKAYQLALWDELQQVSAAHDTLMSLNYNYGQGHSKKYYQIPGRSQAEFIAHAFENYYIGNPIFKAQMPDLYADMVKMVDKWVKEFTPK